MADSDIIVSLHLVIPFISMVTIVPFTIVNLAAPCCAPSNGIEVVAPGTNVIKLFLLIFVIS
jgi:hypothetical protein